MHIPYLYTVLIHLLHSVCIKQIQIIQESKSSVNSSLHATDDFVQAREILHPNPRNMILHSVSQRHICSKLKTLIPRLLFNPSSWAQIRTYWQRSTLRHCFENSTFFGLPTGCRSNFCGRGIHKVWFFVLWCLRG